MARAAHRHTDMAGRSGAPKFDGGDAQLITVTRLSLEICDLNGLLGVREPTKSQFRVWPYRSLLPDFVIARRKVMQMRRVITLAIIQQEVPKVGLADAHGTCEHGLEHSL